MAITSAIIVNNSQTKVVSFDHSFHSTLQDTLTPMHLGVKIVKNNIFLRPEEAMFEELVKAFLTGRIILFLRKSTIVQLKKYYQKQNEKSRIHCVVTL